MHTVRHYGLVTRLPTCFLLLLLPLLLLLLLPLLLPRLLGFVFIFPLFFGLLFGYCILDAIGWMETGAIHDLLSVPCRAVSVRNGDRLCAGEGLCLRPTWSQLSTGELAK